MNRAKSAAVVGSKQYMLPWHRAGKAAARRTGMTRWSARSSVSMSPSGVTAIHFEASSCRRRTLWCQWKCGSPKKSTMTCRSSVSCDSTPAAIVTAGRRSWACSRARPERPQPTRGWPRRCAPPARCG
eukprot:212500-Lingulodinium_polyedra.AAC.1